MAITIGSFAEFKKLVPKDMADSHSSRQAAVETYLAMGGVTKFKKTGGFPVLVYPTPKRLGDQIREAEKKIAGWDKSLGDWHRRHKHLKTDKITDVAKRAADPLYWEHRAKLLTDPAYRATHDLVRPPMHLLHREKWRKRLKLFIRSKEYRLRLHEARVSSIGKKRAPMTEEVEARLDFNRQMAQNELKKIEEKRNKLKKKLGAMKTLLAWSKSA
ncbi:MAG: hypothetical protein KAW41_01990 [Candidatus Diapherotrites archaeon]|nr:hypothetical protein [Candidatus Diapherotrites archaeon]